MNRKAFNFYKSYFDVYKHLKSDKDKVAFIDALLNKQFYGIEPQLDGMAEFAYISQKQIIDQQVKGWEDKTKVNLHPTEGDENYPTEGGFDTPRQQEKEKEKVKEEVKEKVEKISKHLFSQSIYINKHKFKEALSDWNSEKLKYYYESLLTWSNEGNKKIDWIATARQWASRDEKLGKLKFDSKSELPTNWMQLKLSEDQKKLLTKEQLGKYETHQTRLSMQ